MLPNVKIRILQGVKVGWKRVEIYDGYHKNGYYSGSEEPRTLKFCMDMYETFIFSHAKFKVNRKSSYWAMKLWKCENLKFVLKFQKAPGRFLISMFLLKGTIKHIKNQ